MSQSLRLNLFDLLRLINKQHKLRTRRDPMFESGKLIKFFLGVIFVAIIGEAIFIGSLLGFEMSTSTSLEPYYIMNRGLLIILLLNWGIRFCIQKLPTQQIAPYATLPIRRSSLIDCLLIRSNKAPLNWFFLSYMLPFALIAVVPNWGILGVCRYMLGLSLLYIANGYWYMLCNTLIQEHLAWIVLPVLVYASIVAIEFIPGHYSLSYATMYLGQGFIEGWGWSYLIPLTLIALLYYINRKTSLSIALKESGYTKTKEEKIGRSREIPYLDRLGDLGMWMQLEIRLIRRNQVPYTNAMRIIGMGLLLVCMFGLEMSHSEGNGHGMYSTHNFMGWLFIVQFLGGGMYIILTNAFGYEGNYMDGLMAKRESIYKLLMSKYYLAAACSILPAVVLTILVYIGDITWTQLIAMTLFYSSVPSMVIIQNASVNKRSIPMNAKLTAGVKGKLNIRQLIFNITLMPTVTMGPYFAYLFCPTWLMNGLLSSIGALVLLSAPIWLRWTYANVLKNKYENLEGFRATR